MVGIDQTETKAPFSEAELIVINRWALDRKMEGLYFIDQEGELSYKEDELITKYRGMNIEQLRELLKNNKSYQVELVMVEKLLQQNLMSFDKKNPEVVNEVTALVLDLAMQGNVNSLQNLIDTHMVNGYKATEVKGKMVWMVDSESYKNALKYYYVLERRKNIGLQRYTDIKIMGNSVLPTLPNYQKIKEAARVEGEQLYQQLESARVAQGLGTFNNQVPVEMDKLYDYLTAPLLKMEQEIK